MATDPQQVIAQFSWQYTDTDGSEVSFKEGELFILLNKATNEWWKVKRTSSDASLKSVIYVPANYVKELPRASLIEDDSQQNKSNSAASFPEYMNLEDFQAIMARTDSTTDSDYSYSDNDTASSLGTSPRALNGSFSPTPQSSTAELRKSLNLDALLGGMLQKQGRPPSIPKSPTIDEDDTNKENLDTKSSEGNVVLRKNTNFMLNKRSSTLPSGWQKLTDDLSGRQYYYNEETKESVWKPPRSSVFIDSQQSKDLPSGWIIQKDDSNEDIYVNSVNDEKWKACTAENGSTYYYKIGDDVTAWELPAIEVRTRGARRRSLDDLSDDKTNSRMSSTFPRNSKTKSVLFGFEGNGTNSQEDTKIEIPKGKSKMHRRSQSASLLQDGNDPNIPSIQVPAAYNKVNKLPNTEGYLGRKKLVEGGKTKKFHWEQVYVCKYDNVMVFYKDKKSSIPKPEFPDGRPESSIDLRGATLDAPSGDKTKGKKNVFQITTFNRLNVMMLMAETPSIMGYWITSIQLTLNELDEMDPLPPTVALPEVAAASSHTLTVTPRSNGGPLSPGVSRKDKSEKSEKSFRGIGSRKLSKRDSNVNEEDTNKTKIKDKLKKFLPKRPTYYELEKKGIIKQEIFGCHLDILCKRENVTVPKFVIKCIEAVERRGLHVRGIYRECGNASLMHKLRISTDQGERIDFDDKQWADIHVIAGALKWYFRELPEPLIPAPSFDSFVEAIKIPSNHERKRKFKSLIETMPKYNHDTLKVLLQHLLKVVEFCSENKMAQHNCSIVFGPTLLRPEDEEDHLNIALNTVYQNQIVNFLLLEYAELFATA